MRYVLTCLFSAAAMATSGCGRDGDDRPRLAVMVVVDGLPAELLDRYDSAFTGGFRRLRDYGFRFTEAQVDHGITVSHAGHVTLATGMTPAHHGIVDAAFYEGTGQRVFADALADSTERVVGDSTGGVSPRNVLAGGIAEWTLDADPEARVAAVGSGAYSSLLHVFHQPADVYWFDRASHRYVTSSYYRTTYPDWVTGFNDVRVPEFLDVAAHWDLSVPEGLRGLARPDRSDYEAYVGRQSEFPHYRESEMSAERLADPSSAGTWLAWTPYLDYATLELAGEAVRNLALGQRPGHTDYLSIVLSEADGIGHFYGSHSLEQFDNLLRIDSVLGAFLDQLDERVGWGRWLLALTADHGMPDIPEERAAVGLPGRRVTAEQIDSVQQAVAALVESGAGEEEIMARIEGYDFVADAYVPDELAGADPTTDEYLQLYRNSYRPDRVPRLPLFSFSDGRSAIAASGIMVRLVEGAVIDLDPSNHGTPYEYDRDVPLVFFGTGVFPGTSAGEARTYDVAPTLAALMGITPSARVDGHTLLISDSGPTDP